MIGEGYGWSTCRAGEGELCGRKLEQAEWRWGLPREAASAGGPQGDSRNSLIRPLPQWLIPIYWRMSLGWENIQRIFSERGVLSFTPWILVNERTSFAGNRGESRSKLGKENLFLVRKVLSLKDPEVASSGGCLGISGLELGRTAGTSFSRNLYRTVVSFP